MESCRATWTEEGFGGGALPRRLEPRALPWSGHRKRNGGLLWMIRTAHGIARHFIGPLAIEPPV